MKKETPQAFLKRLGSHVKAVREKKGMSLRDVELNGDVSRGYLSELENGKANVTFSKLYKVITALEMTTEDFFKGFE